MTVGWFVLNSGCVFLIFASHHIFVTRRNWLERIGALVVGLAAVVILTALTMST